MTSGVLIRNPDILWRDEQGERDRIVTALESGADAGERGWVILVDRGEMTELNLLAGDIWVLADGSRGVADIAAVLADRYDAPAELIAADVGEFVDLCLQRGWLQQGDAA